MQNPLVPATSNAATLSVSAPATVASLKNVFQETIAIIDAKAQWYEKRRIRTLLGATTVRVVGFISLAVGVLLPVLFPTTGFQSAYFALLLGGLALTADQVFMLSRTWTRRVQAQLALSATRDQLNYDWLKLEANLADDNAAVAHASDALELLRNGVADANKIVLAETASWQADLEQALKALVDRIDSTAKSVAADVEQQRKDSSDAAKRGGLNLTIRSKDTLSDVQILVDDKSETAASLPVTLGFADLVPGPHKVKVEAKDKDGKAVALSKIVTAEAGVTKDATIDFP